jgi:SAM-dependent methyltransferase
MTDHRAHAPTGHVHLDEAHWQAVTDQTEREGELFLPFVTKTAEWVTALRGIDGPPLRRIIDIGSGPGVGTCELARLFPDARVTAVDSSPAMLKRAAQRAESLGLGGRVICRLAELPDGLDGLEPADLIWASMSLHHIGDEVGSLQVLRDLLAPGGLIAIAELDEPLRSLPDDLDLGRPGLAARLDTAGASWFAAMREGLPDTVASQDLRSMLISAGFTVTGFRVVRERFDPPLSEKARQVVLGHFQRLRGQLDGRLEPDDIEALQVLSDPDDRRGVMHRSDVFVSSSRQIFVAQPAPDRVS